MKDRIRYLVISAVLLAAEFAIAKWGTGFIRSYIGDVLIIPTIWFLLRGLIWPRDGIFQVYVLPLLTYFLGWTAEIWQAAGINSLIGVSDDSPVGIIMGSSFDLRDILCYFAGLMLIGLYLAAEGRSSDGRRPWYPLAVFLQWTWGYTQTMAGLVLYLCHLDRPHTYYKGVVRTYWPSKISGLSLGMFIFTPDTDDPLYGVSEKQAQTVYSDEMAVHEYGHTFQSLLLGPLYLLLIGLPSILWGTLPVFEKMRREKNIPYTSLYCERWASDWGEAVTKEKALRT